MVLDGRQDCLKIASTHTVPEHGQTGIGAFLPAMGSPGGSAAGARGGNKRAAGVSPQQLQQQQQQRTIDQFFRKSPVGAGAKGQARKVEEEGGDGGGLSPGHENDGGQHDVVAKRQRV